LNRKDAKDAKKTKKEKMDENEWSNKIIGACIEVHRALGPGLLESIYQQCLAREFSLQGIPFQKEVSKPVSYKDVSMECGLRLDFIVDNQVIVELKAVESLLPVHKAQIITYLKLTSCKLGLLINFNVPILKDGIERVALDL
jgi:GxxExxY protein